MNTDFTTMSRDEIRDYLTGIIGDAELPEDVRESLVLTLENREDVTDDEFWGTVGRAFGDDDEEPVNAHDDLKDTILAIVINNTETFDHRSEYLQMFDLRNRLAELEGINPTRAEVDAAILDLHLNGPLRIDLEEGFRFLIANPEYHEAGVTVGGEVRHLLSIRR